MSATPDEQLAHAPLWLALLCGGPYDGEVIRMYAPQKPANVIRGIDGSVALSCAPPEALVSTKQYACYRPGDGSEYWYLPLRAL